MASPDNFCEIDDSPLAGSRRYIHMKILNLYAGLGGNRKLWTDVDVTAVELNPDVAKVYQDHFPDDTMVISDASEYLVEHYKDFDFIWSSPPCQSHSKIRYIFSKGGKRGKPILPDMSLWQEIVFLTHYSEVPWVVENVKPYYKSLWKESQVLGRHYFWSNFDIPPLEFEDGLYADSVFNSNQRNKSEYFDLSSYSFKNNRKCQLQRNCVKPEIGQYVKECSGLPPWP